MLTRRCNMQCRHCSVESHPRLATGPSSEELAARMKDICDAGASFVLLTGGEPMLRPDVVLSLLRQAQARGVATGMVSNGFWGKQRERAFDLMASLKAAGLGQLALSYDAYHAEFQGLDPLRHLIEAAAACGVQVRVSIVRGVDESALPSALNGLPQVDFRFYDLQPVGAARQLDPSDMRAELEGSCSGCCFPAVTDDGRVTACNGPAYFDSSESPLSLGHLSQRPLTDLLQQHRSDPILETLRSSGPRGLQRILQSTPAFQDHPWKERYGGMCELCHEIRTDAQAVAALREHFEDSRAAARLEALRQVRTRSSLRPKVVGESPFAVWMAAFRGETHPELDRVLGRTDLDWAAWAEQLCRNGLATPTLAQEHRYRRWAPRWFAQRLQKQARSHALMRLVSGEIYRQWATMPFRVVLLKNAALGLERASGDLDVWCDRPAEFRRALLEGGWQGDVRAACGAAHHLAAVSWRGVTVEIHSRLMPAFWGLPESDMLARAVRREDGLWSLSPEALLLHAMVHCTKHLFVSGLKTGFDLQQVVRQPLDWRLLESWAAGLPMPRSFWTPLWVLRGDAAAPAHDWRQRWLDRAARESFPLRQGDQNVFLRAGLYALLAESWRARLGSVARLLGGDSAEQAEARAGGLRQVRWSRLWADAREAGRALRLLLRRARASARAGEQSVGS